MSSTYVDNEIKKVLQSAEYPKNMALACAWVIANFKGINIKIFDVSKFSSLCDFNIIATAENTIQAKSIASEIQKQLRDNGATVNALEGLQDGEWILLDMGDFIVHIFQDISREVFNLEELWSGATQIEIPNEYYYGSNDETSEETSDQYF
jgi:ribosome-associated protein